MSVKVHHPGPRLGRLLESTHKPLVNPLMAQRRSFIVPAERPRKPCIATSAFIQSRANHSAKIPLLDTFTFYERLGETKYALICFTAPGCGSCGAFQKVLPKLQDRVDNKNEAGYAFPLKVFEVDAGNSMGLVEELEIVDLPALFVYVNGEYHAPIQAPPEVESLYMAAARAVKQPAHEEP